MQYRTKENPPIGMQTVLRPRRSRCPYLNQDVRHILRRKVKPPNEMQTEFLDTAKVLLFSSVQTEVSSCLKRHQDHVFYEKVAKKGNLHIPDLPIKL